MTGAIEAKRAGLTSHQLRLLGLMAEAARLSPEVFLDGVVRVLPGVSGYADLDEARFNIIADAFVAIGFRHPALPLVSAAQLAALDACRRQLGLSSRDYVWLLRHSTDAPSHRMMTGAHFLALWAVFDRYGVADWSPEPGFVDRGRASALRRTAWHNGVTAIELRDLMIRFGGCTRLRGLDARAYGRVLSALHLRGRATPAPAPSVVAEPGMATQAQVNLLWRAWIEARRGYDASEASLDLAIGLVLHFPGGLATLTRAGAREMTAWFVASLVQPLDLSAGRLADRLGEAGTGLPS